MLYISSQVAMDRKEGDGILQAHWCFFWGGGGEGGKDGVDFKRGMADMKTKVG